MIDLYLWRTPNGYKPLIFVEEAGLEYRLHPVNIGNNEQFEPAFLEISPNNKIPAMVDDGESLFESGAILLYLAQKSGQFMPTSGPGYFQVMQWLMWQIGGLGPMMGQAGHFNNKDEPYAKKRYWDESHRLMRVLDKQLGKGEFVTGDYSIADMAIYPWIVTASGSYIGLDVSQYPNVHRWMTQIGERPAVKRSYEIGAGL